MAGDPGRLFRVAKFLISVYHKIKRCCYASASMKVAPCEIVRAELVDGNRVVYEHPKLGDNGLEVDAVVIDYRENPPVKHKARLRRRTRKRSGRGSSRRS